mgnify:CR=1 FL=1
MTNERGISNFEGRHLDFKLILIDKLKEEELKDYDILILHQDCLKIESVKKILQESQQIKILVSNATHGSSQLSVPFFRDLHEVDRKGLKITAVINFEIRKSVNLLSGQKTSMISTPPSCAFGLLFSGMQLTLTINLRTLSLI